MSKSKRKIASYTGRRSRGFSVRDLTRVALMTAILAVCGWITIPLPEPMVPFTLQTFGVFLCLLLLGAGTGPWPSRRTYFSAPWARRSSPPSGAGWGCSSAAPGATSRAFSPWVSSTGP